MLARLAPNASPYSQQQQEKGPFVLFEQRKYGFDGRRWVCSPQAASLLVAGPSMRALVPFSTLRASMSNRHPTQFNPLPNLPFKRQLGAHRRPRGAGGGALGGRAQGAAGGGGPWCGYAVCAYLCIRTRRLTPSHEFQTPNSIGPLDSVGALPHLLHAGRGIPQRVLRRRLPAEPHAAGVGRHGGPGNVVWESGGQASG